MICLLIVCLLGYFGCVWLMVISWYCLLFCFNSVGFVLFTLLFCFDVWFCLFGVRFVGLDCLVLLRGGCTFELFVVFACWLFDVVALVCFGLCFRCLVFVYLVWMFCLYCGYYSCYALFVCCRLLVCLWVWFTCFLLSIVWLVLFVVYVCFFKDGELFNLF